MTIITTLGLIIVFGLAIVKIYEIIFGSNAAKQLKNAQEAIRLQLMFFAEFTYKSMNNADDYKTAPKEIYTWLNNNFKQWIEDYKQRKLNKDD